MAKNLTNYERKVQDELLRDNLRTAKEEQLRRLQLLNWQKNPLVWLKERFGEDPLDYEWSSRPGYEDHSWDGDKDPAKGFWMALADGHWAAIEAATGCHGAGTPIMLYSGDVLPVENIQVGDFLMGDDSTPRKVLSLARGSQQLYTVTPARGGIAFTCNEDHILSLRKRASIDKHADKPQIKNVSIREYLTWNPRERDLYGLYRAPVEFAERATEEDAYMFARHLSPMRRKWPDGIEWYLCNSREIRLKLLAGVIDLHAVALDSCFLLSGCTVHMLHTFRYLAETSGFYTESVDRGEDIGYTLRIYGPFSELPMQNRHKKKLWKRDTRDHLFTNFTITPKGFGEYYGFELDGNHLYLLGDCTVTHNTSKTFMLSRILFWFLDCFKDSLVVTSAPKQAQLELHLWAEVSKAFHKFKRIRPKAALYNLRLVVEDIDQKDMKNLSQDEVMYSKSWQAVGFIAGIAADEQSATKAQGFHRKDMLIITEETPGMPEQVLTAFKNTCTGEHNLIAAVGNPDHRLDPLHRFSILPSVHNYRISAYDYPNVVQQSEIIPGAVTQKSINMRALDYGKDSDIYKSRVRGISPSQSTTSLIQIGWIEACMKTPANTTPVDGTWPAVGVDVAQSIDGDKAALAWGRSNTLVRVHDFYCRNATDLANNLFMTTEELMEKGYQDYRTDKLSDYDIMGDMIGVDVVGLGVATLNELVRAGFNPQSLHGAQWPEAIQMEELMKDDGTIKMQPRYKFRNLRSQMWWELREDLRLGNIIIDLIDSDQTLMDEIIQELALLQFKMADNFIAVESKDDVRKRLGGKSPNKGDSIVYWNWTRKGYRLMGGEMPILGGKGI